MKKQVLADYAIQYLVTTVYFSLCIVQPHPLMIPNNNDFTQNWSTLPVSLDSAMVPRILTETCSKTRVSLVDMGY